jgi:phosphopantothenoylcysteine decarboxylase/phosphopantothenate--cysteine ligase
VVRRLKEAGHRVRVVPTDRALNFVGRATWEAVSGEPVVTDVFSGAVVVNHVQLARSADLVLVAPATADLIARTAVGLADDLLTTTLVATSAPIVMVPAMHTGMWANPATQANVARLRERGVVIAGPAVGRLTGPDSGPGRMIEPEEIVAVVTAQLGGVTPAPPAATVVASETPPDAGAAGTLNGRRLVVTAGGTREPLDPVRFLQNASSGRQGFAIAAAAIEAGAEVTLVAANTDLETPAGARLVRVGTALEMEAAVAEAARGADGVVMAAAVADFRPEQAAGAKLKRGGLDHVDLRLVPNPDILQGLIGRRRPGQVVVGFAAETGGADGTAYELGARKARAKGADLTVVNDVAGGAVFGQADNRVWIFGPDGAEIERVAGSKLDVGRAIVRLVAGLLAAPR